MKKQEAAGAGAVRRVERYMEERVTFRSCDQAVIHALNTGTEREAELLVADLKRLVKLARKALK